MTNLTDPLHRLEAAEEGSRDLDIDICMALGRNRIVEPTAPRGATIEICFPSGDRGVVLAWEPKPMDTNDNSAPAPMNPDFMPIYWRPATIWEWP